MYEGTITRRMKSTRSETYRNLLTHRDFETKIEKLKTAKSSQKPTIIADLCEMFKALGIPCENEQEASYYAALIEENAIPEFQNVEESILKIMYENFENYPTPEEYMQRIVDRLSDFDDGWQKLSLRLKILRRFIKHLNCCVYVRQKGKARSLFGWEKVILDYARNIRTTYEKSLLNFAAQSNIARSYITLVVLDKRGEPLFIKGADGDTEIYMLTDQEQITDLDKIREMFTEFIEKTGMNVRCVSSDSYPDYSRTVVIEWNECSPSGTRISDIVDYIDEGIFDEYDGIIEEYRSVLTQAQTSNAVLELRDQVKDLKKKARQLKSDKSNLLRTQTKLKETESRLKEENKKIESAKSKLKYARERYSLVRIANDLSIGIFKSGGSTKQDLYLFAIAFDMTYMVNKNPGAFEATELSDYRSDIEKNLFEDYYANNLMRFITASYDGDLSALELDPSGIGINYKNFAEMVYVYFISQDLEPIEKLRRATDMIERLKVRAIRPTETSESTRYYTAIFTEDILKKSEAEFEEFISNYYDCNVGTQGFLQIQTAQETAFRFYNNLISDMEEGAEGTESFQRDNCNYGIWFFDISSIDRFGTRRIEEILEKQKIETDRIEKFVKLLFGINAFIGYRFKETPSEATFEQEHKKLSTKLIKKMSVSRAEDMTRTALIAAFYYRYNQLNENRGSNKSFVDVMDDYTDSTTGLNSMLEASGYQPINDRNIFDLAVIFSSYAYLSM